MKRIGELAEIAERFRPGSRTIVHTGCAAPTRLVGQFATLAAERGPFELFDLTTLGTPAFVDALGAGSIRLTTYVPGRAVRGALRAGQVSVVRQPLSTAPSFVTSGRFSPDFVLLHVSPPGPDGFHSLGISCDVMRAVLESDATVIAQVNSRMPFTLGNTRVAGEKIDYWMEVDEAPLTVEPATGDATDMRIADNVASLIASGDVLQTGIGTIPDLTAARLGHLRDLGLHTGIFTEALRPLIEKGIVTNAGKAQFEGRTVCTLAAGSESLYEFLHRNEEIEFQPCSVTHDRATLGDIPRLCAINGALEIDLSGNVNSEFADGKAVSAPGGQPDFAAAAARLPKGKSIIALRATSKHRDASRIVARMAPNVAPTIRAGDIDYVVTEFGIARTSGLQGSKLAHALIEIADPAFRAELRLAM